MKINSSRPDLVFVLLRSVMMAYMSPNNSRKLLNSLIVYPGKETSGQHATTLIETSSSIWNCLSKLRIRCLDLIENNIGSQSFTCEVRAPISKHSKHLSAVRQEGNENFNLFNLFLNYVLHIYKHWCEATDLWNIPYESSRKQLSCLL